MPITSTHAQKKFKKEEKANPHKVNSFKEDVPDPVRSSPTPLALFTSHWYVLYITKLLRTIVLLIDCASENLFAKYFVRI